MARRGTETVNYGYVPTDVYARDGFIRLLDYAVTTAYALQTPAAGNPLLEEVLGPVTAVLVAGADRREGRVNTSFSGTQFNVELGGYSATDLERVEVVAGLEGLRCAVDGTIDGASCRLSDYLVPKTNVGDFAPDVNEGFAVIGYFTAVPPGAAFPHRLFIVEKRAGTSSAPGAGGFREVAPLTAVDATVFSNQIPIARSEFQAAHAMLASDPDDMCVGSSPCGDVFDTRLPLEHELTDDGDAYENSWRHYMAIARDAADRADLLGEQLIERGLGIDFRAESAVEELAAQCGGSISLAGLFSTDLAELEEAGVVCPGTACSAGFDCHNGRCVLNTVTRAEERALSMEDQRLLAECLGDDSVYDLVSLGSADAPLCVWHHGDDTNLLCSGNNSLECPFAAGTDGVCDGAHKPLGDYDVAPISKYLGFFGSGSLVGADTGRSDPGALDCDLIRRARMAPVGEKMALVDQIRATRFFTFDNVQRWVDSIHYEARPFDYSAITLNDASPWLGTGTAFGEDGATGPSSSWPCAAASSPSIACEPGDSLSLFCAPISGTPGFSASCGDRGVRAALNDRMGRAALALALTSDMGIGNLKLPVYFQGNQYLEKFEGAVTRYTNDPSTDPVQYTVTRATDIRYRFEKTFTGEFFMVNEPVGGDYRIWTPVNTGFLTPQVPLEHDDQHPLGFVVLGEVTTDVSARPIWTGMFPGPRPQPSALFVVEREFT